MADFIIEVRYQGTAHRGATVLMGSNAPATTGSNGRVTYNTSLTKIVTPVVVENADPYFVWGGGSIVLVADTAYVVDI